MVRLRFFMGVVLLGIFPATDVFAASFEVSLQSLVSAVVGKIMPICALPFVAKTALGWVRGDAQSVQQLPTVAIGVIALLGINGVWAFLQSHVH